MGGWFSNLFKKFDEQKKEFKQKPGIQYSSVGTEIYGGYLEEEFLGELRNPRQRYRAYHEMRSSSGIIKMCIKAVKDQLKGSTWGIRSKVNEEERPEVLKQLEFMGKAFPVDMHNRIVTDITSAVIFGFYLGEIYYETFDFNGQLKLKPQIKFISQRTIDRWIISKNIGLHGIVQQVYGDTTDNKINQIEITRDKLVHMAIDQEGENYEGVSLLRPIYGNWVRKNSNYKKIAIGNHFMTLPYLKVYQNTEGSAQLPDEEIKKMGTRLAERSQSSKALSHMVFPAGWTAEEQTTSFDPLRLYDCNDKEDTEIVRAFCANFLLLTKGSGSNALSNDLSDFFLKGLEEIAKQIDSTITGDIIERTINVNFNEDCLIECYHSEIGGKGGVKLADAISRLLSSRAITMDNPTEDFVREVFGLPKHDPETARDAPTIVAQPQQEEENSKEDDEEDSEENETETEEDVSKGENRYVLMNFDSTRKGLLSQAKASQKRITNLQTELKETVQTELTKIVKKQAEKIRKFIQKNSGTQKLYRIKVDDFKVSSRETVKKLTDKLTNAFDEEKMSLSSTINLASSKLKSVLAAKMMFKNMATADINDAISRMNMSMIYELLAIIDTVNDPVVIETMIFKSTTTMIKEQIANKKVSVLPSIAVNKARKMVYESQYANIESYTFYNPSPVADICVFLSGRTVAADDPDLLTYQPPLHYNCSTVILPNLKEFKNNPKTELLTPNQKQIKSINIGVKSG